MNRRTPRAVERVVAPLAGRPQEARTLARPREASLFLAQSRRLGLTLSFLVAAVLLPLPAASNLHV